MRVDTLVLRTGIIMEMDSYPQWNKVYFPTMMRWEKAFFCGHLMNPEGRILIIASQKTIASWNHSHKSSGNRISTTNLDLMHRLPLPERHPQILI